MLLSLIMLLLVSNCVANGLAYAMPVNASALLPAAPPPAGLRTRRGAATLLVACQLAIHTGGASTQVDILGRRTGAIESFLVEATIRWRCRDVVRRWTESGRDRWVGNSTSGLRSVSGAAGRPR